MHTPDIVMTPRHIGIVACSPEGAALCYRTICVEGVAILGPHAHPEVTVHTPSLADYMAYIYCGDWTGVGELMLASARKLKAVSLPLQMTLSGGFPGGVRGDRSAESRYGADVGKCREIWISGG